MTDAEIKTALPFFTVTVSRAGKEFYRQTFQQPYVKLGRDLDSDICLSEYNFVSRKHLTLHLQKESVKVIDEGSKAGTRYLDEKVSSVEISSHGTFEILDLEIHILFTPGQQMSISEKTVEVDKLELTSTSDLMSTIEMVEPGEENDKTTPDVHAKIRSPRSAGSSDERRMFFGAKLGAFNSRLALRTTLVWDGQALSSSIVQNNEPIVVSGREGEGLYLPNENLKAQPIGYVKDNVANIFVSDKTDLVFSENYNVPEDMKFETDQGVISGLLTLKARDRVLVKLTDRIGISYEFVDASERLNGAIFKEEDRRFFEIVRNLVLGTVIVASVLLFMSDSKQKVTRKEMTKKRVVEVVIPEEVKKKPEPKPVPKPKPKVAAPPKPKPKPKVAVAPKPKPNPTPKPKPIARPRPKPTPKPKVAATPRPKKRTKAPPPVRVASRPRVQPKARSQAPKPQKPTNTALAAFASFNKINTFKPGKVSKNFKIDPSASKQAGKSSGQNLIQSLNKGASARAGTSSSRSALSQVSADFSGQNLSDKTGKRAVKGAVVGAPKLQNDPNREQGLSPAQVMGVVNRHLSEVQRCYERALFDQPNLSGRVEYEWTISPRGAVQSVSVRRSEATGDKKLNDCVKRVFSKMKFPAATNGQSTVTSIGFPFGKL